MKKLRRILCGVIAAAVLLSSASCADFSSADEPSTVPTNAVTRPQIDPEVGEVLRSFYQDQLPSLALRSGVKDQNGEEIRCNFSMLQKSVFVDFDDDGAKEIVLLYDVSEQVGEHNRDVVVFVDEKDGAAVVAASETGSYGASKDGETYILSRYNGRVCKVCFMNKGTYEAVLIQSFENGTWKTDITAYRHISDHDGVKLENDSCYIDHAGGGLYEAVRGKEWYSKEKFLNFRTPNENYNSLITALLAETLLP